jgi:hypothetical protein
MVLPYVLEALAYGGFAAVPVRSISFCSFFYGILQLSFTIPVSGFALRANVW